MSTRKENAATSEWEAKKYCVQKFFEWFDEQEGFHIREERFWDDCERGDNDALYDWLRVAFNMGFQAGRDCPIDDALPQLDRVEG